MADIGQGTGNTLIHSRFSGGSLIFYNSVTGAAVFTISPTGTSAAGTTSLADDQPMVFGGGSDMSMEWDTAGTDAFRVTPGAADSAWEFGDGTAANRMDVKFWGADTTNNITIDASADTITLTGISLVQAGDAQLRIGKATQALITAKTTDYTVLTADSGTIFTTLGASGTVVFTLPTPAAGLWYRFFSATDNQMTVAADAADKIITFNDVDADSVTFSTGSQKTGAYAELIGLSATKWALVGQNARTQNTMTVTT